MYELISGFLIGLLTSMMAWHILFHRIVPSLEFFPAIYKKRTDENPSGYKYRIKFRNTGRREVLDVELFAKLRIGGCCRVSPNFGELSISQLMIFEYLERSVGARKELLSNFV